MDCVILSVIITCCLLGSAVELKVVYELDMIRIICGGTAALDLLIVELAVLVTCCLWRSVGVQPVRVTCCLWRSVVEIVLAI